MRGGGNTCQQPIGLKHHRGRRTHRCVGLCGCQSTMGNIQSTLGLHSVRFREHSLKFREHSVNLREHSVNVREHSVNFREHSVNFRGPAWLPPASWLCSSGGRCRGAAQRLRSVNKPTLVRLSQTAAVSEYQHDSQMCKIIMLYRRHKHGYHYYYWLKVQIKGTIRREIVNREQEFQNFGKYKRRGDGRE
jgi:hypothetical protein